MKEYKQPKSQQLETHLGEYIKKSADVLISEFNVLKSEVNSRSNFQNALLGVAVAASATVISAYFNIRASNDPVGSLSENGRKLILFSIPLFLPILGFLWLDHRLTISIIGRYIQYRLKPQLHVILKINVAVFTDIGLNQSLFHIVDWEDFHRQSGWKNLHPRIFTPTPFLIFGLFPLILWIILLYSYINSFSCVIRIGISCVAKDGLNLLSFTMLAFSAIMICFFFYLWLHVEAHIRGIDRFERSRAENAQLRGH